MADVETTETRAGKLKKILAGTGIAVGLLAGGTATDYYVNPRVKLESGPVNLENITPHEYAQLKSQNGKVISKLAQFRAGQGLSLQDVALVEATLTIEVADCGGFSLPNFTQENYQKARYDWLWDKLTNDKCP